jgi:hypothetical protein
LQAELESPGQEQKTILRGVSLRSKSRKVQSQQPTVSREVGLETELQKGRLQQDVLRFALYPEGGGNHW